MAEAGAQTVAKMVGHDSGLAVDDGQGASAQPVTQAPQPLHRDSSISMILRCMGNSFGRPRPSPGPPRCHIRPA